MNTLTNAPLADLLQRLFAEAEASAPGDSPALADLSEAELKRLMGSKTEYREFYGRLKDLALPVSRETGCLLYMLARSSSARSIVEFGTSFGLSTLHLAAALRDNGGGRLIGSEFEPSKAERARRNLAAGGLLDLVELREGEGGETEEKARGAPMHTEVHMKFEKNTELDQANLRLIVATCAILYVVLIGLLPGLKVETYLPIVAYYGLFLIASILLRQAIVRWPGHYPARRIFCMLHDYAGTSFGLIVGGEAALPLYAVMVWINLGNGMRYGSRYLAIATALALLALLVIYRLTPAWQAQPFMVLMLMTTSTVIPFYAHLLLERTRKATEEALQANQEKSRLLAQASHDLRQPIHSIGLFTACLRDARLGDEERRLVDNIDRSLLNVSQLFRSILDLYTLDNGRLQPKQENVHLGELLRDLVRRNAEAARWAGVELRLRPCRLWTRTDPGLLSTMLQNLLSNSLKYAAERPLLIGVRRRGDGLAVAIYDQGRGIAEEHLPRVFEEFYRVRETRDRDVEGIGLGLSIVRRLGQLTGIEVTLRSRVGRGTAVTLHGLPAVAAQALPRRDDPLQAGLLTGLRVCLVEDDRNVLRATSALLERWGCTVQAETEADGWRTDCDILVVDYDLGPHASGVECIERVRRQRGEAIPALVISGHDIERIQASVEDTDIALLSKPVRPTELRATLRALRERPVAASHAS